MVLECDYLIIGTGASGMAFADVIVSESKDRTIIMVDKLPNPGGHWNHAYEFVRLHQPACYYGVASEKLERKGETALWKYKDLSNRKEILEYYRFVMDKLVKTGRVRHFGECTYNGTGLNGEKENMKHSFVDKEGVCYDVRVKRRIVDSTYLKVEVPSTHPPRYDVKPGINCIPINGLYGLDFHDDKNKNFIIVGAGKTGIDAILYLLDNCGVDPSMIKWIMPRDAWMFNRSFFNPQTLMGNALQWFDTKKSLKESLLIREKRGCIYRLNDSVWPTKYSCATVEEDELVKLRSIRRVIRGKGRVSSITKTHIIMNDSNATKIPFDSENSVVVDCSSNGLTKRPAVPIFYSPGRIILQPVRLCQVCISAAMTAYVDCHPGFTDDDDRNRALTPIPHPNSIKDSLRTELLDIHNDLCGYGFDPRTRDWYENCRLNFAAHSSVVTNIKLFLAGGFYRILDNFPNVIQAKKEQHKQEYDGVEYEYETKVSPSVVKLKYVFLGVACCFYTILIWLFHQVIVRTIFS